MVATSSTVNVEAISARGSYPARRTNQFAKASIAVMTGRMTRPIPTRTGARTSSMRTEEAREMFLGTISPNTTWAKRTTARAAAKPTTWAEAPGSPARASGASTRCAMAGSATTPRVVEATVTPSWQMASMRDTCRRACRAWRLPGLPCSARGSIWERLVEVTANSPATKNALTPSRRTVTAMPSPALIRPPPAPAAG